MGKYILTTLLSIILTFKLLCIILDQHFKIYLGPGGWDYK